MSERKDPANDNAPPTGCDRRFVLVEPDRDASFLCLDDCFSIRHVLPFLVEISQTLASRSAAVQVAPLWSEPYTAQFR
jgi:hypothetical protein